MSTSWVGKTLGKVQIETLLARGGMAEVYLGTHITLERKVAVKILRNPSEKHSDDFERFQREAKVIASLRHPNIVQVYDFDTTENDSYLVMEYVDGPSLSVYLHHLHSDGKKLPLPQVIRLLGGVASALQYAHNNKIIHRDIKPGNILLTSPSKTVNIKEPLPDNFEPVLTDFGLIRFLDSARQTTTGVTAGTPAYMSPEQAQGDATDGQTDVYSLGIVLYEMLAGKLPFDGETTVGILLKHVNEPPAPIPGLSPFMQDVINRALAKKREDRFPSPSDFARAFRAAVEINPATIPMDALAPAGPSTMQMGNIPDAKMQIKPEQPKRSNWMRIGILGAAALGIGAFLFFNKLPAAPSAAETRTVTQSSLVALPTMTNISTITPVPRNLETTLVIHFRDANAIADQAFLEVNRVPAPLSGNNYEVWLFNADERISLGLLSLDASGKGSLSYTDDQGNNLVAMYDHAEITLEPEDDNRADPTSLVVFNFALPDDGVVNIRSLLSSFPAAPDKSALIQGLYADVQTINKLASEMGTSYTGGDEAAARQSAEGIMNLIVGVQSPSYKDWDGDGSITDNSTGYGFEINGSNLGYLGAIYTEANNALNSNGASKPMLSYGPSLKTSIQNLAQWSPEMQELIAAILETPEGADIKEQIVDVIVLADQMVNGLDLNSNGIIEEELGEGGAFAAYQLAYDMADMPLATTGLIAGIGTPTPPGGLYEPTAIGGGGGNGGAGGTAISTSTPQPGNTSPGQVNTDKPPNPNKPPTNTPKPPKTPNNKNK